MLWREHEYQINEYMLHCLLVPTQHTIVQWYFTSKYFCAWHTVSIPKYGSRGMFLEIEIVGMEEYCCSNILNKMF